MSRLNTLFAALCLAPTLALAQMATAPFEGRLKKIQETKTISVAYRTDALPFSFEDNEKKPAGYMVDLCRSVIGVIERQIGVTPLQVKWVPVTVQTRFSAIASGQADMECGATTVTLGRMKEVGFSTLTFVDGTGLLVRNSTAGNSLMDLANKKIGVIAGTSNERALAEALKAKVVTATVVPVKSREEGLAQLEAGTIDAFASDRVLLVGLASKAKDPKALALLGDALSYEPYAIVLPRGDWAMRQAVDAALAQIYRSSALPEIYNRWFGALGRPSPVLEVMFALGRLPDMHPAARHRLAHADGAARLPCRVELQSPAGNSSTTVEPSRKRPISSPCASATGLVVVVVPFAQRAAARRVDHAVPHRGHAADDGGAHQHQHEGPGAAFEDDRPRARCARTGPARRAPSSG